MPDAAGCGIWGVSVAETIRQRLRACAIGRFPAEAFVLLAVVCCASALPAFAAPEATDTGALENTINLPQAGGSGPSRIGPAAQLPPGNPLWAIPLRLLTDTRERPLFSPSRRPPPAAVGATPVIAPARPAARPGEPDHPQLTLVGTVVSAHEAIAIFVEQASKTVIRLRTGQGYEGWTLRAIHERDTVFENPRHEAILALPARSATGPAANAAASPAQALPSGTWMDGDGQIISPPVSKVSTPVPHPATWRDGDGRLISPPTLEN